MIAKHIESPLSAFNNILVQISDKIELIYINKTKDISFINKLLFEKESITICNQIKLIYKNGNIYFKFLGDFDNTEIIEKTIENKLKLIQIFQYYLFISNNIISNNFDNNISIKFIYSIYEELLKPNFDSEQLFIVPYKNKINHLYDNDKTIENLYNRFTYIIKFSNSNNSVKYSLNRCLSSELNENKSLSNIRFEEVDRLKHGIISKSELKEFLIDLFYYGEIKN